MPIAGGKAKTHICRRCGHVASFMHLFMNRQVPTVHTRVGTR